MARVVQKYGGSSLATPEHVRSVATRVAETRRAGHEVVVVVSAPSGKTDELRDLAHRISDAPAPREMDMLLSVGERISMPLLAIALGTLLRLIAGVTLGLGVDECYAVANARQLQLSLFDHPPLSFWITAPSENEKLPPSMPGSPMV